MKDTAACSAGMMVSRVTDPGDFLEKSSNEEKERVFGAQTDTLGMTSTGHLGRDRHQDGSYDITNRNLIRAEGVSNNFYQRE